VLLGNRDRARDSELSRAISVPTRNDRQCCPRPREQGKVCAIERNGCVLRHIDTSGRQVKPASSHRERRNGTIDRDELVASSSRIVATEIYWKLTPVTVPCSVRSEAEVSFFPATVQLWNVTLLIELE
jgi:hypothetical protein